MSATNPIENHNAEYTAYAVCRTITGKGLMWYDWSTAKWTNYPDYTTDKDRADKMAHLYQWVTVVAVDMTVSNARII